MSEELDAYEVPLELIQAQVDKTDWSDLLQLEQGKPPSNPSFVTLPSEQYTTYYHCLRALLSTEQASQRAYHLTTFLLSLRTNNYYALMLRKKYYLDQPYEADSFKRQLFFANCVLNINPKEYQLWTYKKQLLYKHEKEDLTHLHKSEMEFIDYLLDKDNKNYHAWDYRLWLVSFMGQEKADFQMTEQAIFGAQGSSSIKEKIEKELEGTGMQVQEVNWKAVYPLWNHRWQLRQKLFKGDQNEGLQEITKVKRWLEEKANRGSECGWSYLTGCIIKAGLDLYKEGMWVWELWKEETDRMIGGAYLQLSLQNHASTGKQLPHFAYMVAEMKGIDSVRQLYYDYLTQNYT